MISKRSDHLGEDISGVIDSDAYRDRDNHRRVKPRERARSR